MAPEPPNSNLEGSNTKKQFSKPFRIRSDRLILYLYLFAIVIACLYLIIFVWNPTTGKVDIDVSKQPSTVPSSKITNGTKVTVNLPTNITNKITKIENATTVVVTKDTFREFQNGTTKLLKRTQNASKANLTGFPLPNTLASPNKEVRLVSLSALFGMLGGAVSAINSVLTKRIWDSGKYVNVRRLLFHYYGRPWIAMSVGIVTYITIRAGLVNVGTANEEVTALSEFGVAAIGALVGLMTSEIITRLRDIFRTFFGITSLQNEQELQVSLQKNSVIGGHQTIVTAVLTNAQPNQDKDLIVYFFIQDPNVIEIVPPSTSEEKFSSSGVASIIVKGKSKGQSYITAMLLGDSSLYDTQKITVESSELKENSSKSKPPTGRPSSSEVEKNDTNLEQIDS
jgi:hypothetical protein